MNWFRNLNTNSKLWLVYGSVTLLASFAIGWSVLIAVILQMHVSAIRSDLADLKQAAIAQTNFMSQWLAVKNYALTGDALYLNKYQGYNQQFVDYLRQARIDAQSLDEQENLRVLSESRAEWETANSRIMESVGPPGPLAISADSAAQRIQSQFQSALYKQSFDLQQQTDEIYQRTYITLLFGPTVLILLCLLTVLASVAVNMVTEPLTRLNYAVIAFQCKTYEEGILKRYFRRKDEMGALSIAFNGMVQTLTDEGAQKNRMLQATSRFVPTQYLEILEKRSITDIKLGDHVSAEMAVMFSDVRGFTTLSEFMTPQQNFTFVNEYLQLVSPAIQKHDGFVVKFLGDGMMAIFPFSVDDAVRAGIEKQQKVREYNALAAQRGQPAIQVGVGIHTGHMMVGIIGDELRMQGDAFSDNVNLTSRVEGLTKFFGVSMLITEETRARLVRPIPYQMRFVGKVAVVGRDQPIGLYEVFDGEAEEILATRQATKSEFERGLNLYLAGRLSEAMAYFEAVQKRDPADKTAQLYLGRIQEWAGRPIPEDWTGIEVFKSK